ncbi:MAG: plasmid pRiA4b ORF-3 family protein [Planctomycetia bacterium]|nr:plasmid pRiA4b ORF-3 family protein [Planctomycetia bacterium]
MAKKKANTPAESRAVSRRKPAAKPARAAKAPSGGEIFQVKVTLVDIRPRIWRRLQTRDCSLAKLHDLIQTGMGWSDGHLHVFEIEGKEYGHPEQWPKDGMFDDDKLDERKVKLSTLVGNGVKKFRYEYDLGDSWQHAILLEKTLAAESGATYPRCVAGERACPPEDCGGPWGYYNLLEAMQNPTTPRHEELLEWLGGEFEPEAFDLDAINQALARLR